MNIAVVGGGVLCRKLMDLIEAHTFRQLSPKIVAVADPDENSPGMLRAKEKGLFTTKDYNDFFVRDDIDLIMELTRDYDIYHDILLKKKKTVRAIDHRTSHLFWEISFVRGIQERTEQKLEETNMKYRVIINELLQDDFMVVSVDHKILDINDNLLKSVGLKREEAIGEYCYKISHLHETPCSGEDHPCPLQQTVKTKKPFQTTHIHRDKNNKEIYCSMSCYPIIENDEVVGVIEIMRDISEEIQIQKTVMQQEKLASIGRLAAGVAHEINNPLTTILTSTMLIQEEIDANDPNYQELQTVVSETIRCRKIVSSLLDFARVTEPEKEQKSLNDIIRECVVLTRKKAAFSDITIEENFSKDVPLLCADKDKMQQALINLALNAIEATDPGGKVTFTSKFIPDKKMIEIAVTDSGKGIAKEDMENIFDPFYTTKESGTGLGLSITHGIIEQHFGTIDVKSTPETGTCFTIRLPLDRRENNEC
ncbi:ATP-binding protein [Thermodesulfobacteriota bacterium]